jgi:hypothetical protein
MSENYPQENFQQKKMDFFVSHKIMYRIGKFTEGQRYTPSQKLLLEFTRKFFPGKDYENEMVFLGKHFDGFRKYSL